MTLDVNKLTNALLQVFHDGVNATSSDEVAKSIAQAIHAYVSAATVTGVAVDVVDANGTKIGTGTQTAPVVIT